jgi:Tfp pilus assembly protein PilO
MKSLLETYNKYKLLLFPLFIGFAGLLVIIFVIIPQVQDYFKGQEQINELAKRQSILEAKAKALESVNKDEVDSKLTVVLVALPIDKDYPGIIGLIQKLVADNGLTLTNLQIGSGANANSSGVLNYSLKVETSGPKDGFNKLVPILEKASRIVKIGSIEFTPLGLKGDLSANFTLEAYYGPIPSSVGAVDAPLPQLTAEDEKLLSTLAQSASLGKGTFEGEPLLPRGKANPFE